MISINGKACYLACGATDMRKSINGLTDIVEGSFRLDPFAGSLFVFCNRNRDRLKILEWDGDLTAVAAAENQTEIAALKARISELERLQKYYEEQLRISKHRQYGASSEKSEHDFTQLSIFNEAELFADANEPEPELIEIAKHYRKRTRLTTDKLPEDLPVEVVPPVPGLRPRRRQ